MKKSVTKNYIYNLIYQILIIILPLITAPYVSRILGPEKIGIYGYTLSISAYFILLGSLGTALYGQREIAFFQNDKKKYSITFFEIFILRTFTLAISMIIFYFCFGRHGEYAIYYRILLLEILGNIIDISWFFQGLEEFKRTVTRNFVVKIISVICIFIFVKTKEDLYLYYLIYIAALILGNLTLWLQLHKFLEKVKLNELKILRHIKPIIALFVPQIAIQVYTILDKTMIGAIIADKTEVGYYEQAQKIIKILLTIEGSLGTVMMPRIAKSFAENDKETIKTYLGKSFHMAYFLAFPLIFGIIVIANAFVPLFFGAGYDKTIIIMQIISPIILFIGISGTIGHQYLLPTKKQKEYTLSVICGCIVNVIINGLLIYRYGALGAAVGTVIAEFTVALVQIVIVRKELNMGKMLLLCRNYLIASIIMFIGCKLVSIFITKRIILLVAQVFVGVVLYFGMLFILKDEFFKEVLDKVFNLLKKGRNKSDERAN